MSQLAGTSARYPKCEVPQSGPKEVYGPSTNNELYREVGAVLANN